MKRRFNRCAAFKVNEMNAFQKQIASLSTRNNDDVDFRPKIIKWLPKVQLPIPQTLTFLFVSSQLFLITHISPLSHHSFLLLLVVKTYLYMVTVMAKQNKRSPETKCIINFEGRTSVEATF
jgi:hypothetical protein